jgi:hypothetical protein
MLALGNQPSEEEETSRALGGSYGGRLHLEGIIQGYLGHNACIIFSFTRTSWDADGYSV